MKNWVKENLSNFKRWLSATNNLGYLLFLNYLIFPKKGSLSDFLDSYSRSTPNLKVLQVGANDGLTHDPIHKFIKRDSWQGVLLEPQPLVFERQLKKVYRKDKGIKLVCAAIGAEDGQLPLFTIGFSQKRWATGLSTFVEESLQRMIDDGTISKKARKFGDIAPTEKSEWIKKISVQVLSPKTIQKQYELDHINLLMVDAEGFDADVVHLVIDAGIKPDAMIFEYFHIEEITLNALLDKLSSLSYAHKKIGPNILAWKPYLSKHIRK